MAESANRPKFVKPGVGQALHSPGGDRITPKVGSAESGGAFQLTEDELAPGGGPPLHVHAREDETFYVLEGEVTFFVCEPGDARGTTGKPVVAPRGSTLFGARGTAHTFRNRTDKPAKLLIIISPGANFEAFFQKIGVPGAAGGEPTEAEMIQRLKDNAPSHGITILGPNPL